MFSYFKKDKIKEFFSDLIEGIFEEITFYLIMWFISLTIAGIYVLFIK